MDEVKHRVGEFGWRLSRQQAAGDSGVQEGEEIRVRDEEVGGHQERVPTPLT